MNDSDDTRDTPAPWPDREPVPCKVCGKADETVRRRITIVGAPPLCQRCFEVKA